MIYLDNAATTFPKPDCVIRDLNFCLKKYCGNPGRSSHTLSLKASEAIYSTREKIADLLHVENPENIVFTYNATYALNIAIKCFVKEKCHIITSDFEHNSVIRPLEGLKRRLGVEYSLIDSDGDILCSLRENARYDTRGIICSIASNLTGNKIDLKTLSDFANERSYFLIIDASQAIGHQDIDLSNTPCDALCAPGHKAMFGIQGAGFVYFKASRLHSCGKRTVLPARIFFANESFDTADILCVFQSVKTAQLRKKDRRFFGMRRRKLLWQEARSKPLHPR